jgi:hypothetical protein
MIGVILEFEPLLYYSKFSAAYFEKDFLKVVFYINTGSGVTEVTAPAPCIQGLPNKQL